MDVTAVILSAEPVTREIPGVLVHSHVSTFDSAEGLLAARKAAIERITTPWFFFLDDDDELPFDFQRVLGLCTAVSTPIAYTDEIIRLNADTAYAKEFGPTEIRRRSKPYSQHDHIEDHCLIHHLAVCRTDAARWALTRVPDGHYGFEPLVWFEVAKGGATYIPEVGYIWNRRDKSMSKQPGMLRAMVLATAWAHRNRT